MNYSEALIYIKSLESKDLIFNDPFLAYSIIRDCIGNSFENKIIAKRYLDINLKLNVFRIIDQYGIEKGLNILHQAYKDLFSYIPLDEYKAVIKPIAMLYDSNFFIKQKEEKKQTNNSDNKWNQLSTNSEFNLKKSEHITKLNINSTCGNIYIVAGSSFKIVVDSSNIKFVSHKYQIKNSCFNVSITYKKRIEMKCDVYVYIPNNLFKSIIINSNNCSSHIHLNCKELRVSSNEGNIEAYGDYNKVNLSSKHGLVLYKGNSNYISVISSKNKHKLRYGLFKYSVDKHLVGNQIKQVLIRKNKLSYV